MPKANRICHCCGREYYYCPSCPDDRRNPRLYIMWDSEKCRDIFNVLSDESVKKITTLECKEKLIKLGVNENTILKDSIRKHINRVMSCEKDVIEEIETLNMVETETKKNKKNRGIKKGSLKNKENSEVD